MGGAERSQEACAARKAATTRAAKGIGGATALKAVATHRAQRRAET